MGDRIEYELVNALQWVWAYRTTPDRAWATKVDDAKKDFVERAGKEQYKLTDTRLANLVFNVTLRGELAKQLEKRAKDQKLAAEYFDLAKKHRLNWRSFSAYLGGFHVPFGIRSVKLPICRRAKNLRRYETP